MDGPPRQPADLSFQAVYGGWSPRRPADVAELLTGYDGD